MRGESKGTFAVEAALVRPQYASDNAALVSFPPERNPTQTNRAEPGQPSSQPAGPGAGDEQRRKRTQGILRALLRYGGSAVALALLFRFLPGRQVLQAMEKLPPWLWVLVLAGYLATHLLGVMKWRLMVNTGGAGLNYVQGACCYFAGLFGSLILPSLIGGDLVRVALAMRYGKTKAGVLLGSFLDRIIDFAGLVLLAATGALLAPQALEPQSRRVFLWVGAAAGAGLALAGILLVLIPARKLSFRFRRKAVSLRRAAQSTARRPQAAGAALGISIVTQLAFISLTVALANACGLRLAFRAWLFAWPLAKLSAAIPVTQGGIGVREAALAGLLAPFGASATLTVAVGLAWETIVVGGALLGGIFALAVRRRAP